MTPFNAFAFAQKSASPSARQPNASITATTFAAAVPRPLLANRLPLADLPLTHFTFYYEFYVISGIILHHNHDKNTT
jgi:hypothetical protein